jgi:hypothetical protein
VQLEEVPPAALGAWLRCPCACGGGSDACCLLCKCICAHGTQAHSEQGALRATLRAKGLHSPRRKKGGEGYTLVGAEQTGGSTQLHRYTFPFKTVLLLGSEKEGIPVDLLALLDSTVEVSGWVGWGEVGVGGCTFGVGEQERWGVAGEGASFKSPTAHHHAGLLVLLATRTPHPPTLPILSSCRFLRLGWSAPSMST